MTLVTKVQTRSRLARLTWLGEASSLQRGLQSQRSLMLELRLRQLSARMLKLPMSMLAQMFP